MSLYQYGTELQNTIGKNIRKLRKEEKLSQEKFSAELNLNRATLSQWENGNQLPSIEDLVFICNKHNIELDCMLGKKSFDLNSREQISNKLGLSTNTINNLMELNGNSAYSQMLEMLADTEFIDKLALKVLQMILDKKRSVPDLDKNLLEFLEKEFDNFMRNWRSEDNSLESFSAYLKECTVWNKGIIKQYGYQAENLNIFIDEVAKKSYPYLILKEKNAFQRYQITQMVDNLINEYVDNNTKK